MSVVLPSLSTVLFALPFVLLSVVLLSAAAAAMPAMSFRADGSSFRHGIAWHDADADKREEASDPWGCFLRCCVRRAVSLAVRVFSKVLVVASRDVDEERWGEEVMLFVVVVAAGSGSRCSRGVA